MVPVPVNMAVLPVTKVRAVVVAVTPLAKLTLLPKVVVSTGAVAPPKVKLGALVPLKLISPVPVADIVPLALDIFTELLKVNEPVAVVITSVADTVFAIQVIVPASVNAPVVVAMRATRLVVASVPVNIRLPVTLQVPALIAKVLVLVLAVG